MQMYNLISAMNTKIIHDPDAAAQYPMAVSDFFARTADCARNDALWRQVLPSRDELTNNVHFTTNPLQEQAPSPNGGCDVFWLQKYAGRALLVTTPRCFGNCRFCFRRHLRRDMQTFTPTRKDYEEPLFQLSQDPSIREVILSGGDPLTLDDATFFWLLEEFGKIEHVKRIRVHTRAPIFCPDRFTKNFQNFLEKYSAKFSQILYFVIHVNHPDELTPESVRVFRDLLRANVTLLQQGVLLRGVNDDPAILAELYEKLIDLRVLPYYLHQLDRVAGASHFEVPEARGLEIMQELRGLLSGFAVPRYVREIPGENAKVPIK